MNEVLCDYCFITIVIIIIIATDAAGIASAVAGIRGRGSVGGSTAKLLA